MIFFFHSRARWATTEAVLLVDHHEAQIGKLHLVLYHGMCADENVQTSLGKLRGYYIAFLLTGRPVSSFTFTPTFAAIPEIVS